MLYDNEKIGTLMRAKKLSGNALAKLVGISGPSMHAILNGESKQPKAQTLYSIAAALGVHPREIIKRGKTTEDIETQLLDLLPILDAKNKHILLGTAKLLAAQQKK